MNEREREIAAPMNDLPIEIKVPAWPLLDIEGDARKADEALSARLAADSLAAKRQPPSSELRLFATGANRNLDTGKLDFDGFLHPAFIEAFGTYMHFNRHLENGDLRDSDNWQKGIPTDVCRKSMWRHFLDAWKALRGHTVQENIIWALMGLAFNVQCITVNLLKEEPNLLQDCLGDMEQKRKRMWEKKRADQQKMAEKS